MKETEMEQTKKESSMSFNATVALIGFFGGLIWSFVGYIAFYLNFTRVGPALALMPWALGDWKNGWLGQLVGMLFIAVVSIGAAFLYRLIFAKINQPWPGMLYGLILWLIIFGLFRPMFPGLKPLTALDANTIITNICLYIVYGLFIGYSISYEYHERTVHEGEAIQS
ncbi:Conserved membrane protein YqhR [Evansella caseinilytica]|uniref:Conserved membrane protein YqhR n=1 Tax=Evansella caseinilytica TaxID=1503961 RepID=A0A1H3KUP3_9BACI|nr:YqhR family membrane protein [Evansella caseinilytica]SDY55903.1 Conserved membrane protein YqhR [Evansella caseinilytica]